MSSYVLVDTNIWHFGFVKPREKEFAEIHQLSRRFLSNLLADEAVRIALSTYQAAEVLEVLRRSGVDERIRLQILEDFGKAKFYVKELPFTEVVRAVKDSSRSNIHIYDYLVAYPLRGVVGRIYSADEHFTHPDLRTVAEVVNPLSPWLVVEGRKPERRSPPSDEASR